MGRGHPSQKPLRAPLAIRILHVIYPYVSLILSETPGTRQPVDSAKRASYNAISVTFKFYPKDSELNVG